MNKDGHLWVGLGGVAPHDTARAQALERRLHIPMAAIALLSIPAFYLETVAGAAWAHFLGSLLSVLIFGAFSAELFTMLMVSRYRLRYLLRNWLGVVIVVMSGFALMDVTDEFVPLLRLLRLAFVGLMLWRALRLLRRNMTAATAPYIIISGAVMLTLAGAGFYWLEPTVHSYGEGLWLAFTTGATVGYGDIVPTTTASRVFAVVMVLLGFAMLSLATASIAAFFIGEDEATLRREMHRDIKSLREEVARLRQDGGYLPSRRSRWARGLVRVNGHTPPARRTRPAKP